MPKPLFIQRPSGVYVRFLVPHWARAAVGSRFLVRSLGDLRGDAARLAAARLGYALSEQLKVLRGHMAKQGQPPQKIRLRADTTGNEVSHYSVEIGPDGSRKISADGAEDHARAMEAWRAMDPTALADLPSIFSVPNAGPEASHPPAIPPSLSPAMPGVMLAERSALFLAQFAQKKRAAANVHDTTHTMRLFVDIVGDKPLASIGAEDMDLWLDALAHYPPNATKLPVYKDLSPRDVVALAKRTKIAPISLRTREKHLDRLRVFFNWAVSRRDLDRNPCAHLHVMTREQEDAQTRRSFTPGELARIFNPETRAKFCRTPAQWWLPAIALYTGARAQELAQLHVQDVEEVNGIWGIHIAARFESQRLKNRQSKRFVPLHPALLAAGFLTFVKDVREHVGDSFLFSELGTRPGDAIGDWFNRTYLKKHCEIDGQVFHCFRHSFITAADRAGIPDHRIARITGHSQGTSVLRGHYIDVPTLAERAAAVAMVNFETVAFEDYSPEAFTTFFDRLKRRRQREKAVAMRKARASLGK